MFIGDYAFNTTVGPDNVIGSNGTLTDENSDGYGVVISGIQYDAGSVTTGLISGNKVQGNRIGVGSNGENLGNKSGGIKIDRSQATLIGGTNAPTSSDADRGNIVANNGNSNLFVNQSDGTLNVFDFGLVIKNNYIGLKDAATPADAPTSQGIRIVRRASGVTIDSNAISANTVAGVQATNIGSQVPSNIAITSNKIGPNAAGTAATTGTQANGVQISGGVSNVTITGNVLTANRSSGVSLTNVSNVTIANNGIGTLLAGNASVGNTNSGVSITSSTGVTVGPGNLIEKHSNVTVGDGVLITGSSTGNIVKGNTIRANVYGVRIEPSATGNVIGYAGSATGATGSEDGNLIIGNNQGIQINGAATLRNRVSRTGTSGNLGTGIALSSGANAGIPAPSVSGAAFAGGNLTGTINTGSADCAGPGCVIEVFQAVTSEPNQGKYFLTSFRISGSSNFTVAIANCMPFLTFTTTDQNGNTSPFSAAPANVANCTATEPVGGAVPDLFGETPTSRTLDAAILAGPVDVSFTASLKNTGSASGAFSLSITAPSGWTNATVTPTSASPAPNGAQIVPVSFGVRVPQGTAPGSYTLTVTAAQSGGASDSVSVTVIVPLIPALTFSAATPATKPGGPNAVVCFTHQLTNNGNGNDSFTITVTPPGANWQPTVTPASPVAVNKGETRAVDVCVTVPTGTTGGDKTISVVATSVTAPNPSSPARIDTVQVQDSAVPQLTSVPAQSVNPDAIVTFTHRLTNVGNVGATFALALTLPSGWTVVQAPTSPTTSIAPSGNIDFTYSVRVPATALAGDYPVRVTATAQQGANASTFVDDVVTVNKVAKLQLTIAGSPSTEPPNSLVTYTLSLTNLGNFPDTVSLTVSDVSQAARGWAASVLPSPSVVVAPGASVPVQLVVRIPPGQPVSVVNDTTVRAVSSLPAVNVSATARTNIQPVAAGLWQPPNPVAPATAGITVTFNLTLLNSGSLPQDFTTQLVSTVPATATVVFTPTTRTLQPGESLPVKLLVRVPPNQPDGTEISVKLRATSSPGNVIAETTARVRIGPPYDVVVAPNRARTALPGAFVEYTHTVTNTGRLVDSYNLTARSNLGWNVTVEPVSVRLQPGASATVTVRIEVPSSAEANSTDATVLTARSTADPAVSGQATAATNVLQVAGATLSPDGRALLTPGKTIAFQHTLLNSGNGRDSYVITSTQELSWTVRIEYVAPPTRHERGLSLPVQVTVVIAANTPVGTVNRITIRARSRFNQAIFSEVVDTVASPAAQAVATANRLYLPMTRR